MTTENVLLADERATLQAFVDDQRTAIAGLLLVARKRGLKARTVDLRSSGDTAGPRDEVVGYGGYVFDEE